MHQKSLNIKLKVFGPDHLEPAKTKVNIGLVYNSMGGYEKALHTYNEAPPVLESTLGCDHECGHHKNEVGASFLGLVFGSRHWALAGSASSSKIKAGMLGRRSCTRKCFRSESRSSAWSTLS